MEKDLYCNRDFIPDFDELIAETAARSAEFSRKADVRPDVPYGTGARERIDLIFPPRLAKGAPLHLFIHGGYWRAGTKEDHRLVAAPVIAQGGIAAIVEYDLMPGTRLGAIVAQVRAATRHLAAMAPELGADPARLSVSGHSAGAHLASYLAATGPEENGRIELPVVRGMLLISGIYDLSEIPGSFLKHEAKMTDAEAKAWSPLTSHHDEGPRRIVMVSEHDTQPFHTQGEALLSLLQRKGLGGELRVEPGLNHLTIVLELADTNSAVSGCVAELLAL